MSPRTRRLLQGAIVPTLLLMAWPNILVMTAQAATGLIETWWVSKLGTDALAGMALVFPGFMMMQMLSAGAIGGGIASAVARALGANRRADADALVLHALLINLGLGLVTSALFLIWGRPIYAAMGGEGASLEAALAYSNVVFAGNALVWLMNALGSLIRGTGNMLVPALSVCLAVALLIPLSPLLIFGWGPVPAMGIAGGGFAVLITSALTTAVLAWYLLAGRSIVRLRRSRLQWPMFADILRVGGVGTISTLQTSLTVALTTALVGAFGGPNAVAGYGTGARIEYLLIPLVFGLGAPMVALVGTNIGAGQPQRALRIARTGGALAFALTETIGIGAAIWPEAWLGLFGHDPHMLEAGAAYLRVVGPTYGFFGLGLSLYFASQGAGRLAWPLLGGMVRLLVAVGGGWLALTLTGSLAWAFAALALALVAYGAIVAGAVASGVWFRHGDRAVSSRLSFAGSGDDGSSQPAEQPRRRVLGQAESGSLQGCPRRPPTKLGDELKTLIPLHLAVAWDGLGVDKLDSVDKARADSRPRRCCSRQHQATERAGADSRNRGRQVRDRREEGQAVPEGTARRCGRDRQGGQGYRSSVEAFVAAAKKAIAAKADDTREPTEEEHRSTSGDRRQRLEGRQAGACPRSRRDPQDQEAGARRQAHAFPRRAGQDHGRQLSRRLDRSGPGKAAEGPDPAGRAVQGVQGPCKASLAVGEKRRSPSSATAYQAAW